MQNHLPQSVGQQSSTPNTNSTSTDLGSYFAPAYRDHAMQMRTPSPFRSCHGSASSSHPSIQTGKDIQHLSVSTLSKKSQYLRPPLPPVSNQFSYAQADSHQRTQSWMECSSSPLGNRSQIVNEIQKEHFYGHGRMSLVQRDTDGRSRFSTPIFSGPAHVGNAEGSYAQVSHISLAEHAPISNGGRSLPPRILNYGHHQPPLQPPLENQVNRAPNF